MVGTVSFFIFFLKMTTVGVFEETDKMLKFRISTFKAMVHFEVTNVTLITSSCKTQTINKALITAISHGPILAENTLLL